MREISYRKKQSLEHRRKMISIHECSEEKDCATSVRKNFIYILTRVGAVSQPAEKPEIFIRKSLNTCLREEKFSFRVKGSFFMARHRDIFRVDFCHTLRIDIVWKQKAFSPKKSATLT